MSGRYEGAIPAKEEGITRRGEVMKDSKISILNAALILLVLSNSTFAYRQVIYLGAVGGNYGGCGSFINDNGEIVGMGQNSSGKYRGVLFDPTGGGANIDLKTLGGDTGWAYSINNNGQIVGQAQNTLVHGSAYSYACRFDPTGNGANKNLGTVGGTGYSSAYSINNQGQIVGYAPNIYNFSHATLFNSGGNIDLGSLGGANSASYAWSINDLGQIVGYSNENGDRATLFDPTGGGANIKLSDASSRAYSINDLGQIVGRSYGFGPPSFHACLFDPTGMKANIDLAPNGGSSEAFSINDLGQIVGYINDRAYLFDSTGQDNNIDLNTLIDPASGWVLTQAKCINSDGWIVGQGIYDGGYCAFLLVPEPATLLLFALGGLALRRKK